MKLIAKLPLNIMAALQGPLKKIGSPVNFSRLRWNYMVGLLLGETTMKLLTAAIQKKLLANGKNRDKDHAPVVKFFGGGACTWLISEMDPEEPDILFGLCDLGAGFPELGSVSLAELKAIKFRPFGLGVERDLWFKAEHPMSWYAEKAREAGRIVA